MSDQAAPTTRPLRADARRNRDQVLAVAREMLSAGGSSVSFDEIARCAGVGVGTVYRHFPTRSALFEAVVIGRIEKFIERARTLSAATAVPGEAFRDYFAYLVGDIALNQALCEALEDDAAAALSIPDQLRRDFVRCFDGLLSRAKKTGAVRADVDIADVLDLLIGAAVADRRARLRAGPNRAIALVLDGLRPH